LSYEELKELLEYDSDTGIIRWKLNRSRAKAGSIAGCIDKYGYICIGINGKAYKAHRLAWILHYGVWPEHQIDHINMDKSDNRLVNLRDVTCAINKQNIKFAKKGSKSGMLGSHWDKSHNKYKARIKLNGKTKNLGYFDTAEEAHKASVDAKRIYHIACTI